MPDFPVVGELVKCEKCGREILVERGLIGIDHTFTILVSCWQCLKKESKKIARKKYQIKEGG